MTIPKYVISPPPSPQFHMQVSEAGMGPFIDSISGEVAASVMGRTLAIARFDGYVKDVNFAVHEPGKDNNAESSLEVDVKINGTSCLTTKPKLTQASGEAEVQKSTLAGSTTTTAAVINHAANTFSRGDILTWDYLVTTSGFDTNPNNVSVLVEVVPKGA